MRFPAGLAAVLVLTCTVREARAEEVRVREPCRRCGGTGDEASARLVDARTIAATGRALTITSIVTAIAAHALGGAAFLPGVWVYDDPRGPMLLGTAFTLATISTLFAATGVPLWCVFSDRMQRATVALSAGGLRVSW